MPTLRRIRRSAVGLLVAMLLLVGVSGASAADRDVEIVDFGFTPSRVTIRVGDTVTWTNRDPVEHTATATSGAFDTGLFGSGASATIRFTKAGTYRYLCTPHPSMTGTVVVRRASTGGSSRPPETSTERSSGSPAWTDALPFGLLALAGALMVVKADRRFGTSRPRGDPNNGRSRS